MIVMLGSLALLLGMSSGCTGEKALSPVVVSTLTPNATSLPTLAPSVSAPVNTLSAETPTEAPSSTPVNRRLGWIAFSSARDGSRDLYLLSPDGQAIIRVGLSGLRNPGTPAWSPDWQKIAFVADGAGGRPHDILVVEIGCVDLPEGCLPHVRNLTEDEPGLYGYPAWSPDGQKIAYSFRPSPDPTIAFQIWVMNADGSNRARLTDMGGSDPAWSPDGRMIAFRSEFMAENQWGNVFVMNADGSNPKRLTQAVPDSFAPAWSPDSGKIAFVSTEGQDLTADNKFTQIYVINVDGTGLKRLTGGELHGGDWPSWSPDGTKVVFVHSLGGLYIVEADGSNPTKINGSEGGLFPAWQP